MRLSPRKDSIELRKDSSELKERQQRTKERQQQTEERQQRTITKSPDSNLEVTAEFPPTRRVTKRRSAAKKNLFGPTAKVKTSARENSIYGGSMKSK